MQLAKDEDGKSLLFTGVKSFAHFLKSIQSWLKSYRLGRVLRDDPLDIPI